MCIRDRDSTATLQLVWYALAELPDWQRMRKQIHVISTDTLVESPVIAKWVESSLKDIQKESDAQILPFVVHRLKPCLLYTSKNIVLFSSDRGHLVTTQRIGRSLRRNPDDLEKRATIVDFICDCDNRQEEDITADMERENWLSQLSKVRGDG